MGLEPIGLVPHQDARLLAEAEVGEDAFDGANLLVAIGVARVDDVDQEVGVLHLLERGAERSGDQLFQASLADEADVVSVMMTSRSCGKPAAVGLIGSSVANSLSAASASPWVIAFNSVDLPALV